MFRVLFLTGLLLLSCSGLASQQSALYQVDMIVFTHMDNATPPIDQSSTPLLAPDAHSAIPLVNAVSKEMTPYHRLPSSTSKLGNAYWALNHKPQYQVLFHYTWLQPGNNQRAIALSQANPSGWNVEGTIRIRRSNYYLLDTDLLFSNSNSQQTGFVFSQKQRLKPGVVYYLDHPQAGMLITVHQIA